MKRAIRRRREGEVRPVKLLPILLGKFGESNSDGQPMVGLRLARQDPGAQRLAAVYPCGADEREVAGKERQRGVRLELTNEGRYGLRALLYLARTDDRVSAATIADEARIPRRQLARALAKLARAGLVESHEGRGGGSLLARPPEQITLGEAVEAIEGPFEVTRCIMEQRACGEGAPCAMHEAWEEWQETILDLLKSQTLSEFAAQAGDPQEGALPSFPEPSPGSPR